MENLFKAVFIKKYMIKSKMNLFLLSLLSVLTAGLAKAQIYGTRSTGFGNFGDVRLIGTYISGDLLVLGPLFIIIFALVNMSLSRFKFTHDHKGGRIAISFSIAALVIYWAMRSGFDFSTFFVSIGMPGIGSALPTILPIILGLLFFWIIFAGRGKRWKRVGTSLLLVGLMFLLAGFTELVYEQLIVSIVGGILALLGILILFKANSGNGPRIGGGWRSIFSVNVKKILFLIGLALLIIGCFTYSPWMMILGIVLILVSFILHAFSSDRGTSAKGFQNLILVLGVILLVLGIALNHFCLIVLGILLILFAILMYFRRDDDDPEPQPENEYVLNVSKQGNGNTNPSPGRYRYKKGRRASVSATPGKNSKFSHFIVNGSETTSNPVKIKMTQNYDVTAHFKKDGGGGGKKKRREAYLAVVIGKEKYQSTDKPVSMDLSGGGSLSVTVRNGGQGGKLGWAARAQNKYVDVSPNKGTLGAGKSKQVTITPKWDALKSSKKKWVGVSISGRGGGRTSGMPARGRVGIWLKAF
ncbi:MAG: hypothetical protein ABEJ02_01665 [Candidatus Paceibacteria bacterium]